MITQQLKIWLPASQRYNNPGAVMWSTNLWEGAIGKASNGLAIFSTIEEGTKAGLKTLLTYYRLHKLQTIASIISRWCPTSGGDTSEYIRFVSDYCNRGKDDFINLEDLPLIFKAISIVEAGKDYLQLKLIKQQFSKI